MFRYRCPQCAQLLQAPEIRAGKSTVCSKCSQPLTIPADKTQWLNEKGEPLLTSPTVVIRSAPATPPPAAIPWRDDGPRENEPDNDVLGAIFLGTALPTSGPVTDDLGAGPDSSASVDFSVPDLSPQSEVRHVRPEMEPEPEPQPAPEPEPVPEPVAEVKQQPPAEPVEPPAPAFSRSLPPPDEPESAPAPPMPPPSVVEVTRTPSPAEQTPTPTRYPTPMPRAYPKRPVPPDPAPHAPTAVAPMPRTPVATPPPRTPVPVGPRRTEPEPTWATPGPSAPRTRRMVATTPAAAPGTGGAITLEEPLRLRTGMDIAADLTAALATRMKPPPKPPRDLRPSTALWILATGAALVLLAATLLSTNDFRRVVMAIGAAEALVGYVWVTRVAFSRELRRGLLCLVFPFPYLLQRKYAHYRPLRFVVTGAALAGLGWLAGLARPHTMALTGKGTDPTPVVSAPDITTQPTAAQLRYYNEQRQYDALVTLLRKVATTDPQYSEEGKHRAELAKVLRKLATEHPDSGVKVEALAAYAKWGGPDARDLCLKALESANRDERLAALRLLPRWKDESVARRIADRLGRPGTETATAQEALVALGGPHAERAAIARLTHSDDQGVRLTAVEVLANVGVGGADAVAALRQVATSSSDPGTRQAAAAAADQIQARLKK